MLMAQPASAAVGARDVQPPAALYAVGCTGSQAQLVSIDAGTGAASTVGSPQTSVASACSVAAAAVPGTMTAELVGQGPLGLGLELETVDLATGAVTNVGTITVDGTPLNAFSGWNVTVSPAGVTYVIADAGIYTVDAGTGVATLAGFTSRNLLAIAFDPTDGTLYGGEPNGALNVVDPTTLALTPVGGAVPVNGNLLFNLAFDTDGTLWTAVSSGLGETLASTRIADVVGAFQPSGTITVGGSIFTTQSLILTQPAVAPAPAPPVTATPAAAAPTLAATGGATDLSGWVLGAAVLVSFGVVLLLVRRRSVLVG